MANTTHRPNRPMTNKMPSPTGLIARYGHRTTTDFMGSSSIEKAGVL
ncbi:hypothetical protein [Ancylothrix sp. D3o]|nr:hypothetical protein [Ancylothrix sp. D3o]